MKLLLDFPLYFVRKISSGYRKQYLPVRLDEIISPRCEGNL